ncbi:heterogeneous nuclear ribonucleoprotein A3 [Populus alba x Populus x berolinensis]|uniref:Heterogeneous nuclear ribonucleoprotein A3 n=1 Tax=Populus alba x Populus x berolinensis TaxID=444605 RepID=A0AAD6M558_9ROSI|nr:heterogeneous nuclear ribonucleoprotein A3 [Populus alba x Populus x berolinensis]
MKTVTIFFLLALLLVSCSLSTETRPDPKTSTKGKPINQNNKASGNDGGVFGSGSGFGIPGFDYGWGNVGGGYGGGFGGPKGGSSKGGVIKPSVVCKEKGPCYKKKLTCPAKCFTSYSRKLKKKWIMAWQPVASNSSIIISDQACNHGVLC